MYTQSMYLVDSDDVQSEVTDEDVDSLSNALPSNKMISSIVPVASAAVPDVYDSLSQMMWHPSDPYVDKQHAFSCGEFEDGTFSENGGCLWRSLMTVHNWYQNVDLQWHTPLTKCTESAEPTCPPLTSCSDESCTECVLSGYSHSD